MREYGDDLSLLPSSLLDKEEEKENEDENKKENEPVKNKLSLVSITSATLSTTVSTTYSSRNRKRTPTIKILETKDVFKRDTETRRTET